MSVLVLILMIAAIVCFGLAAFGVVASRINLTALGLALWATATIVPALHG